MEVLMLVFSCICFLVLEFEKELQHRQFQTNWTAMNMPFLVMKGLNSAYKHTVCNIINQVALLFTQYLSKALFKWRCWCLSFHHRQLQISRSIAELTSPCQSSLLNAQGPKAVCMLKLSGWRSLSTICPQQSPSKLDGRPHCHIQPGVGGQGKL